MDIGRTSRVLRSPLRFLAMSAVVATAMVGCGGRSAGVPNTRSLLTLSGTGGVNHQNRLDAPYVVLIALDGFRHDYLELYDAPNLSALAARGVRADVVPPLPSKTFPSFYTLATGVRPGRHGIVSNNFWDPDRGERFAGRRSPSNSAAAPTCGGLATSVFSRLSRKGRWRRACGV